MKILTEDKYYEFYKEYGRCIDQIQKPNKPLTEKKLKAKYDKYVKKEERKIEKQKVKSKPKVVIKKDEKWEAVREKVYTRDKHECQLIRILTYEEYKILLVNSCGLHKVIDPAHSIWTRRSKSPKHKYLVEGIFTLNRASHSWLDNKSITKEEVEEWWKRIIGPDRMKLLISLLD